MVRNPYAAHEGDLRAEREEGENAALEELVVYVDCSER